ncbi:MAG TPA: hypothetical protein VIJ35_31425 [Bradyrhizobium sp.]
MPTADTKPAAEGAAFTLKEFCFQNRISPPTYNELRAKGRGPKEIRIGTKVLITPKAEAEWRRARENPVGEEAGEIARIAKAMQERGRRAAKKSVASPNHVSRRRAGAGR